MTFKRERYISLNRDQPEAESDSFTQERYLQFAKFIRPGMVNVLDVGCSTGVGGRALKGQAKQIRLVGMDCVPERVAELPTDVYDETLVGYSTDIPSPDDTFDVVIAGEFIEHIAPGEVDLTLADFFRVLKLGGVLLLTTPNPGFLRHAAAPRLRWIKEDRVLGGAHVSQHFPDVFRLRLRMIGFSGVRLLGTGRMSSYLGQRVPLLALYGSYMVVARKW